MNKNIYSVFQVNSYIGQLLAEDFMLENISVTGEVSNCNYNHTGHIYFTLKDEKAAISCVMFAGKRARGLRQRIGDGDKIVVTGYVGVYEKTGRYQVYANEIELTGVGDLYRKFEELKQRLGELGLFENMYKKPLPAHVMRLGIVTAPTGAAVHDIIRVSRMRNPYIELVLAPAQVQGEGAAASIVQAISRLDALGLDAIIVGRGGGSIEDLWAFNEESVARAIFNAQTPIISAVGHETDFTIADFVADVRAATPSQAAELANFVFADFMGQLQRYSDRLDEAFDGKLNSYINRLEACHIRLNAMRADARLAAYVQKAAALSDKIKSAIDFKLNGAEARLAAISGKLEGLSPAKRLAAGFGYITDASGARIDSVDRVSAGDEIVTRLKDGRITSRVIDTGRI